MSDPKRSILILTGDELRHRYFRSMMARDRRFRVVAAVCEGDEKSLAARTAAKPDAGRIEHLHVAARAQSEADFFSAFLDAGNEAGEIRVPKGDVNSPQIVSRIIAARPDILVCYGSSLIRSELLEKFRGRFLNVHLGLSPYYRGSGTNVWPLVNREPHMVGASFMHIDAGIDTGAIIHQIRADIVLGDGPHSIGNRLISKMTRVYADIVANFDALSEEPQPKAEGRLYKQADWNEDAAAELYRNFRDGMIEEYVTRGVPRDAAPLVRNRALTAR